MVSDKRQSKHVCVIGAGPAGLVSARELRKEGHSVVVLEQKHDIGGQWLYDPRVGIEDALGRNPTPLKVHSSVYASLRLMSPREVMGFTDFPFSTKKGSDTRRFPGHSEVYSYLRDFCRWFGLRELIKFNTRVEYAGVLDNKEFGSDVRWVVRSKEDGCDAVDEDIFDAVVVASGHYSQPRMPSINGIDAWKRKQIHSHVYRVPEPFRNEVVVIVGCSFSGQDISLELVNVAKQVHLSARSLELPEGLTKVIFKYQNLHLHPQIDYLCEDGRVLFTDGSCVVADSIIYCTGYSYSFPFLDTKGIVAVDDGRVGPLYEHTFPPSLAPSLSFVGIPRKILGFPFFESQAKWISQVLSGRRTLPSWDDMMKSIEEFYRSREIAGIPKHCTHDIADFDFCLYVLAKPKSWKNTSVVGVPQFVQSQYCDKYGDHCDFPHLEDWRKVLCLSAVQNYIINLETFRDQWNDDELLQEALQSPHFKQLDPEAIPS